ncbi:hypothetical protein CEUSTIGMA_g370.t1 [Chlamydomonas eustigma]|uniref:Uncharacterized protein n=1 Tax=Chlamydomonas eustigma TaxID=1157962 RepID=A0A250WPZ0_9CHLO|nr:hypothetical protein CEUSTIGMA_g370.t1 [Chlamydomonas eustigma]|eukprot:GAX72915.1 hypothetical protein CEUSTIGMA_g370.t1 [Chlamydomonas eustigma]
MLRRCYNLQLSTPIPQLPDRLLQNSKDTIIPYFKIRDGMVIQIEEDHHDEKEKDEQQQHTVMKIIPECTTHMMRNWVWKWPFHIIANLGHFFAATFKVLTLLSDTALYHSQQFLTWWTAEGALTTIFSNIRVMQRLAISYAKLVASVEDLPNLDDLPHLLHISTIVITFVPIDLITALSHNAHSREAIRTLLLASDFTLALRTALNLLGDVLLDASSEDNVKTACQVMEYSYSALDQILKFSKCYEGSDLNNLYVQICPSLLKAWEAFMKILDDPSMTSMYSSKWRLIYSVLDIVFLLLVRSFSPQNGSAVQKIRILNVAVKLLCILVLGRAGEVGVGHGYHDSHERILSSSLGFAAS